jgi:hypothetical protein
VSVSGVLEAAESRDSGSRGERDVLADHGAEVPHRLAEEAIARSVRDEEVELELHVRVSVGVSDDLLHPRGRLAQPADLVGGGTFGRHRDDLPSSSRVSISASTSCRVTGAAERIESRLSSATNVPRPWRVSTRLSPIRMLIASRAEPRLTS